MGSVRKQNVSKTISPDFFYLHNIVVVLFYFIQIILLLLLLVFPFLFQHVFSVFSSRFIFYFLV